MVLFLVMEATQYSASQLLRKPLSAFPDSVLVSRYFIKIDERKFTTVNRSRTSSNTVQALGTQPGYDATVGTERRYWPVMHLVDIESYADEAFVIQECPGLRESYGNLKEDDSARSVLVVKSRDRHWVNCFEGVYGI